MEGFVLEDVLISILLDAPQASCLSIFELSRGITARCVLLSQLHDDTRGKVDQVVGCAAPLIYTSY